MMRKILAILAAALCASAFAKDIYISSSSGSDTNEGSQAAPLKTIAAAPKDGANIFLKRGDVFYEYVTNFTNCNFDAYGEGGKPVISGFVVLKNPKAWVRLPNNLWRLDLTKSEDFEGFPVSGKQLNVGAIYYPAKDKLYGHLVRRFNALNNDGDFWVSDNVNRVEVQDKDETFKFLYFRMAENPSALGGKICFSHNATGIRMNTNCVFKNMAVVGFGVHGVVAAYGCKFLDMDFDIIGGSVQLGYPHWARLGNGIEFGVSEKRSGSNNLVEGCTFSRTYDCGTTIQGFSKDGSDAKIENVIFRKNFFIRCRQAFEHFVGFKVEGKGKAYYINCEFSDNIGFDNGENEFSTPETRDANLLSYEPKPVNGLKIKNNVFWGASVYCAQSYTADLEGNTFYVFKDQYLFFDRTNQDKTVFASEPDAVARVRKILNDPTDKYIIVDRSDTALRDEVVKKYFSAYAERIKRMCK